MQREDGSSPTIQNFNIERAFLAGLVRYPEALFEVDQYLTVDDFKSEVSIKIFSVFRNLIIDKDVRKFDPTLILAAIQNFNYRFPPECNITDYVNNLFADSKNIEYKTVSSLARDIKIFSFRRGGVECGKKMQSEMLAKKFSTLQEVTSSMDEIYFEAINNFVIDDGIEALGAGAGESLNKRADNPIEHLGFSSGFGMWDEMIGYLRPDTMSFISARAKVGKSMFGLNVGFHVAQHEKLPVLYLDSEMSREEVRDRLIAHVAKVDIKLIETGKWKGDKDVCFRIEKAIRTVESLNMQYLSIRSKNINQILSDCRRFLFKYVKRAPDSCKFNPCLIVYDYLKLDYSGNLGDTWHLNLAKSVVNFKDLCGKTGAASLTLGQQNRAGITKTDHKNNRTITIDTEEIVAGTDEILKTCSNVSSLRFKTADEINMDGTEHGNTLLMPFVCRNGKGGQWCMLSEGVFCRDYINLERTPETMSFSEKSTKSMILQAKDISKVFK